MEFTKLTKRPTNTDVLVIFKEGKNVYTINIKNSYMGYIDEENLQEETEETVNKKVSINLKGIFNYSAQPSKRAYKKQTHKILDMFLRNK